MKLFSQTSQQKSFLYACRAAGKELASSASLLWVALLSIVLCACRDDLDMAGFNNAPTGTTTRTEVQSNSGLTAYESAGSYYYKPNNCRVPLVGKGRVINQMSKSLVSVLSENQNLESLVDTLLSTGVTITKLVGAVDAVPVFSVRDINRVYYDDKGIKVGFIYQTDGGILDADVLNSFYIQTLLKGKVQQTSLDKSTEGGSLVNLDLLNTAGGNSEVSFYATKPFDEVRIGYSGIQADVATNTTFYYAFIGENPEKRATTNGYYTSADSETKKLTNSKDDDYEILHTGIAGIAAQTELCVDFNSKVEKGSEIGFNISQLKILDVDLSGLSLFELNENGQWANETELKKGIGVSLLDYKEKGTLSTIAKEDCYGVKVELKTTGSIGDLLDTLLGLLRKTYFYYAYSRDPVKVDVSSHFTLGNDTISADYYDLPTVSEGTVNYFSVSAPNGTVEFSSDNRRIINMTTNGNYVIKAQYTLDGQTTEAYAIITRDKKETVSGCNVTMIGSGYSVQEPIGIQGGISLFKKIEGTSNLTDPDESNYAEATNVLSLLQMGGLVGVKSDSEIDPPSDGSKTRVGFVMQTSNQLLGADVLKYFFIRLYNGNDVVYSGLTQENNTIGVGLINDNGGKLRFYVETDKTFDRVELWTAGLLNVNLNTFRLYYAFYEPTSCEKYEGTSAACMEMISAQKHGATINYAETQMASAISVGSTITDLSYVIDNSINTGALIVKGVSLIDRTTIAVKFNNIKGGQPVGAVLRSTPNILNVSALQNIRVAAYLDGQVVASESTSSGLASIEVISDSGLAYLEITPLSDYDEVRISFPSLADISKAMYLAGFYIRPDANSNGIPDCAEDPDGVTDNEYGYQDVTSHVCVEPKTNKGNVCVYVSATDSLLGNSIDFTCYPLNGNGQAVNVKATLEKEGNEYFFTLPLPVGDYSISGLSTYNGIRAQVHPLKTTWKKNPIDTDWNNWNNWTDGSPWGCTNVIIPTGAAKYPKLLSWSSIDRFYMGNFCKNIHFEPGAAVLNTQYLDYERAYVDMAVTAGSYAMISTPLHGMVTGDMFVSSELPAYFTQLTPTSYPEVRHNPVVRQKMYSRDVNTTTQTGSGTVTVTADWSRTFNAVAQSYDPAQGIKLMVGNGADQTTYRLRFPKNYNTYNYYNLSGNKIKSEDLPAGARNLNGRFAYEDSNFKPEEAGSEFTFTLSNKETDNSCCFVTGNPFMSYLDIKKFLTENKSVVTSIQLIPEGSSEEAGGVITVMLDKSGSLTFNGKQEVHVIAPLQAYYVNSVKKNINNLQITYTAEMFVQPASTATTRSAGVTSSSASGEMKISVTSGNSANSCLLSRSATASNAYNAKEDIITLIDEDYMPKVKVYTVADKRALDIQSLHNATRVELGFIVQNNSQDSEITLNYGNSWKGWTLVDKQTGNRYKLNGNTLSVSVKALRSNEGRFYLEKQ